ncbi:TlpA family protein disulfide reductase [Fontivita pretiosa]|uniref:TlpA family protein disulfide reductase n=1 Tax=Fontivita pretiosa TaxID=2989684 RepID=UPI003D17F2B6
MNTRRRYFVGFAVLACAVALAGWSIALAQDRSADTQSLKGKPAPDFSLQTLDGKTVTLSEQKGSVVLLDFWATWCGPCVAALPHVQQISADKALAERGLKVWAVNAREKNEQVEKFIKQNNYTFTVPMDADGKVLQQYLVRGIPTQVIVGRDGTIKNVFIGFGGEESVKRLHDAIEAALKEGGTT